MKPKSIYILIVTCIVLYVAGGAFLTYGLPVVGRLFEPRNKQVMVVVAKHDYPKGTAITDPEQMFELREFGLFDGLNFRPGC